MSIYEFDTLSEAVNALTKNGYSDSFEAKDDFILTRFSNKEYQPHELKIVKLYRFDGMTNPADETVVFAMESLDGTKGTLVMSYNSEHSQNIELIKKIKTVSK